MRKDLRGLAGWLALAAAVLGTVVLAGCGGVGGTWYPLSNGQSSDDDDSTIQPFQIDALGNFQGLSAMAGWRGAQSIGSAHATQQAAQTLFDSFRSRVSVIDRFVYVPSRASSTELIGYTYEEALWFENETVTDTIRVTGTARGDPDDPSVGFREQLRFQGLDRDLTVTTYRTPTTYLYQEEGTVPSTVRGRPWALRSQIQTQLDPAAHVRLSDDVQEYSQPDGYYYGRESHSREDLDAANERAKKASTRSASLWVMTDGQPWVRRGDLRTVQPTRQEGVQSWDRWESDLVETFGEITEPDWWWDDWRQAEGLDDLVDEWVWEPYWGVVSTVGTTSGQSSNGTSWSTTYEADGTYRSDYHSPQAELSYSYVYYPDGHEVWYDGDGNVTWDSEQTTSTTDWYDSNLWVYDRDSSWLLPLTADDLDATVGGAQQYRWDSAAQQLVPTALADLPTDQYAELYPLSDPVGWLWVIDPQRVEELPDQFVTQWYTTDYVWVWVRDTDRGYYEKIYTENLESYFAGVPLYLWDDATKTLRSISLNEAPLRYDFTVYRLSDPDRWLWLRDSALRDDLPEDLRTQIQSQSWSYYDDGSDWDDDWSDDDWDDDWDDDPGLETDYQDVFVIDRQSNTWATVYEADLETYFAGWALYLWDPVSGQLQPMTLDERPRNYYYTVYRLSEPAGYAWIADDTSSDDLPDSLLSQISATTDVTRATKRAMGLKQRVLHNRRAAPPKPTLRSRAQSGVDPVRVYRRVMGIPVPHRRMPPPVPPGLVRRTAPR